MTVLHLALETEEFEIAEVLLELGVAGRIQMLVLSILLVSTPPLVSPSSSTARWPTTIAVEARLGLCSKEDSHFKYKGDLVDRVYKAAICCET